MGLSDVVRLESAAAPIAAPSSCATPAARGAAARASTCDAAAAEGASQLKSTRRRRAPLGELPGTPSNANNTAGAERHDEAPATKARRGLLSSRRQRQQMDAAVLVE